MIANAPKFDDDVQRRIEIGFIAPGGPGDQATRPEGIDDDNARLVRDNGIGMRRKHPGQVFEMSGRPHGCDEDGGGTGSRLTIATKLVP